MALKHENNSMEISRETDLKTLSFSLSLNAWYHKIEIWFLCVDKISFSLCTRHAMEIYAISSFLVTPALFQTRTINNLFFSRLPSFFFRQ